MNKWIENADKLKFDANSLLADMKLINILSKYGNVSTTGSYRYNLMTWHDIDICLEVETIDINEIFKLGTEIARYPKVATMYFRNELVLHTPGNPKALFWCIEVKTNDSMIWKIDILIALKEEVSRVLGLGEKVMEKLSKEKRIQILEIKNELTHTPKYRKEYRSVDIYKAVLEEGITNITQWKKWWKEHKQN